MKRFLGKLKETVSGRLLGEGLARTRQKLADGVQKVFAGGGRVDEDTLEALEEVLLGADVGLAATETLLERLRTRIRDDRLDSAEAVREAFLDEIVAILKQAETGTEPSISEPPHVVLLVGVNGTGKTTTLGKLAHYHRSRGRSVLVAAADTFRAAAVDQLRIWAERAGAEIVATQSGADPASVAYDAVARAQSRGAEVVLVDTAGRLQTKVNLMEELRKIARVVGKRVPSAPHEVLLVLDATTGQNAIQQARQFGDVAGITGLVLTKVDGSAKGGVVIAIAQQLGIPVRFLGLGEGIEDLAPFDAESFAAALFGED